MGKLLLKLFVKDYKDTDNPVVRERYGKLSGIVGLLINCVLSAAKIAAGAITGVISVLADGLNNLSDCGSNVVSVIGFKMAGKPADKEHPYGHQRMEYVASMIVSLIILVVAFELAVESVNKIISPEPFEFSVFTLVILCVSVAAKLWMFFFNRRLGKAISSDMLKATAVDSITDVMATTAVIVAFVISYYTGVNLDGYMGCVVAIIVAAAGIGLIRKTMSRLVGQAPDSKMVKDIKERIMSFDGVIGIHDLNVHSYGQSKFYATAHVECDAAMSVMDAHTLADNIEHDFVTNTDIVLVVHIDPVVLDDPENNRYHEMVCRIVKDIDAEYDIHDFRTVKSPQGVKLIFDVGIPFGGALSEKQIEAAIADKVAAQDSSLSVIATVEKQLVE